MPTYEYKCSRCDHNFDEFQSITAKPLRKCPACGKNTLKRVIGCGAGLIFKGSGFYETDYRSESYQKDAKSADQSSSSSSSSDTTSTSDSNKSTSDSAKTTTAKADANKSTTTASKNSD